MEKKLAELQKIYAAFEADTAPFRQDAACRKGCAFCCSGAGTIDITTLEGLAIREALVRMPRNLQTALKKRLAKDVKKRENGQTSACPFLQKNHSCCIYHVRGFACRRIYSLQTCSRTQAPVLSRKVMTRGDAVINKLQMLDDTGYSGHISYILYMLEQPAFQDTYLAGAYHPEQIMDFGKSHQIVINRIMAEGPPAL